MNGPIPHIGEQLRVVDTNDDVLATVGEVVTVVQVERRHNGVFVYVDGRKDFHRFMWSAPMRETVRIIND